MRVMFQAQRAIAFNDQGECAVIEGAMFTRLNSQITYRRNRSVKTEATIIRDILASWPREHLKWIPVSEANK